MSSRTVVVSLVVSGLVVACANAQVDPVPTSENGTTVPEPDAGRKASETGGAKEDAGTKKAPPPADQDPAPGAGQCAGESTFDACLTCCSNAHPDGSDTFYGSYIDCLCQPANCGLDCDVSLCDPIAPTQPDAACDACIQAQGNSCQAAVSAACSADPDCIAFDSCVGDSQCATKP